MNDFIKDIYSPSIVEYVSFGGDIIEDGFTFTDYGIMDGATLSLQLKTEVKPTVEIENVDYEFRSGVKLYNTACNGRGYRR